jgi:hypothetical protein
MKSNKKTFALMERLERHGIIASFDQANTLRRAELTLQRWAELECGDGNGNAIERDEITGKPFICYYPSNIHSVSNHPKRYPIADREKGALKRIQAVCNDLNIHFFHQTDPRGCSLYVSLEPLPSNDYTRGVNCNG